jgi:predicted dinucleotide-binding enzyme
LEGETVKSTVEEIRRCNKSQAGTVAEAASSSEVIVLATPWPATEAAVRAAGNLQSKIVLDCTNPLKPDVSGSEVGFTLWISLTFRGTVRREFGLWRSGFLD